MENLKESDKLKCIKSVNNLFGWPLFIKDKEYNVMCIYGGEVILNHILYANEYLPYPLNFVKKHFEKIK